MNRCPQCGADLDPLTGTCTECPAESFANSPDAVRTHSACSRTTRRNLWIKVAVGGVAACAIMLLGSMVQQALENSGRTQSRMNLEQIGLALHYYHDVRRMFPPGEIVARSGAPQHSWISQIQPYIESSPIYNMTDFSLPWDHPQNVFIYRIVHDWCLTPGVDTVSNANGLALSHYAGSSEVFGENTSTSLDSLPRGTSHTVLAGEVRDDYQPWGGPNYWRDPNVPMNSGIRSFGRYTGEGASLLMADGSVRFVVNTPGQIPARPRSARREARRQNPVYRLVRRQLRPGLDTTALVDDNATVAAIWVPSTFKGPQADRLTDADFELLATFSQLEFLSAYGASDAALASIGRLKELSVLIVSGAFTDRGLQQIARLPKLKSVVLDVRSDRVTEGGVSALKAALPACEVRVVDRSEN